MQLPGPIVSTQWLAQNIDSEALRIFDVSLFLRLKDPEPGYTIVSGRDAWEKNHIPGSAFIDLASDLSDLSVPLPMMMLPPEVLAERAGQFGIGSDSIVVIYAADGIMFAARLWWMLRSIGFDNVAVLDGGWDKWLREDRPSSSVPTSYTASSLTAQPRAGLWAERAEVQQAMNSESVCTLNALQPEVFTGEAAPYGRAGHIPGSHNVYSSSLLDSDTGVFLPLDQLKEHFEASAVMQKSRAILYCGGGVSATVGALALTLLGHPDIAVYDGSMTDWVQDPSLPLVCGA